MNRKLTIALAGLMILAGLGVGCFFWFKGPDPSRQIRRHTAGEMPAAGSGRRVALVIGNAAYRHAAPLPNTKNDAQAMAAALQEVHFELVESGPLLNLAEEGRMKQAIKVFGQRLRGGAVGLFYYSGHGIQVNGKNYLVPTGARLERQSDVKYELVDVDFVLDEMNSAQNEINVIILDACRNNPFAGQGLKSLATGLAQMPAPNGAFIAYATSPNSTAAEGRGSNSPFTAALSRTMVEPGLSIEQVFKQVRREVMAATGGEQTPWDASSLTREFAFAGAAASGRKPEGGRPSATHDAEDLYWQSIMSGQDRADFEAYLKRYPEGKYVDLARIKIKRLPPLVLARIKIEDKWSFIDGTGKMVMEPRFESAGDFHEGLAWVKIGGKYGFIDRTGKVVVEPRFEYAGGFYKGLAQARIGGKVGYIDKTGQFIEDPILRSTADLILDGAFFTKRLARVNNSDKWGYQNNATGQWMVEPKFEDCRNFSAGLACVKFDSKWGYIDETGQWAIPPRFDEAGDFKRVE